MRIGRALGPDGTGLYGPVTAYVGERLELSERCPRLRRVCRSPRWARPRVPGRSAAPGGACVIDRSLGPIP